MPLPLRAAACVAVLSVTLGLTGCRSALESLALRPFYRHADLPAANVTDGVAYGPDAKQRLTLFLPVADSVRHRPWPTVVFVHGGSWTEGDRALTVGGEDIYGNIGRFFASHGIGAATVSYRLLPGVSWPDQIADVAAATARVREWAVQAGGDPGGLVLMGHSAGAQLAARVVLDRAVQAAAGLPEGSVCGAIPVSGAGLDLTDAESFRLADDYDFYARRFGPPGAEVPSEPPAVPADWQAAASVVSLVTPDAPPFLILHASRDYDALPRQSALLDEALVAAGVPSRVVVVPRSTHLLIVPTLSRDHRTAGPEMLAFVRGLACQ